VAAANAGNVEYTHLVEKQLAIFEREGIWQARVYAEGYHFRSLKTRDKGKATTEAFKLLGSILEKLEHNLPLSKRSVSWVIDQYVAAKDAELDRKATLKTMSDKDVNIKKKQFRRYGNYWKAHCGQLDIEKIANKTLSEYPAFRNAYWTDQVANGAELPKNAELYPRDKTIKLEVTYMKSVLRWALERGYRGNKPHPTYTYKVQEEIARTPFNDSDFEKLLEELGNQGGHIPGMTEPPTYTKRMLLCYVAVLRYTGMRVGEANELKADDIRIKPEKDGNKLVTITVRGKTGTRELVARDRCLTAILQMIELRKEAAPSDYFFPMKTGEKITTLSDQFNDVLTKAGVKANASGEEHVLYSLRHNYALDMLSQNVSVFQLAQNMGNTVEVIRKYYASRARSTDFASELRQ
jgi:integrase